MINKLIHYGDILAIPFFILLSIYFYRIKKKNTLEYILFQNNVNVKVITNNSSAKLDNPDRLMFIQMIKLLDSRFKNEKSNTQN